MPNLVHVDFPVIISSLRAGLLGVAILALVAAALHDCIARTIPNQIALLVAIVGLALRVLAGDAQAALLVATVVFLLAVLCWRAGWMGGGDVKLLAAAALVVPPADSPALITAIAATGFVLSLVYMAARHVAPLPTGPVARRHGALARRAWRVERWRMRRGGPLPYAVAISGGCLCVLLQVTAS